MKYYITRKTVNTNIIRNKTQFELSQYLIRLWPKQTRIYSKHDMQLETCLIKESFIKESMSLCFCCNKSVNFACKVHIYKL